MRATLVIAIVGTTVLTGCDDLSFDLERAKQDFHYSYRLTQGGRLTLENSNGSIEVVGWDRNTIDVSGTKFASTEDRLREVKIDVAVNGNIASITTEGPKEPWHGSNGAKYLIRVPDQTTIERAHTANGSISIEDVHGGGHLISTNGRISLARDSGNYDVETTNGSIELEECSGSERAHTTNGAVHGRIKSGAIDAQSRNGSIDFTVEEPQEGQSMRASTTNGAITLALVRFRNNPINAETTNGGVTLRLPPNSNANVNLDTAVSSITNDISLSATSESSKHHLAGRLGAGGAIISASTRTGGIHLERY